MTYIGWLLNSRKVRASTVEKYVSGIRLAHLKAGHDMPAQKPGIVKAIIEGTAQSERIKDRLKEKPATLRLNKYE